MPTSVALSPHFEDFIKAQIASGRYNNVSEVVREGLRLLEDRELEKQRRLDELRAEIVKGMEGPFIPAEQVFAELRQKLTDRARNKG
ncbi:type II toxin-antitoxin system ParD family antitoxin [Asticcacaulis sp. AND118]|uniref:type II toxin-antitoxin system ParD family antitoxin n=1 Tax=Asticcacaulis sp. AND118 TaxID=2840468 RepID=UPI001CFF9703|nr:type II toxin-antitoxin system ParD family antitoxin [Asticcacaulis sp. AND118]UDF02719.1 type II toxin-antitoxin system ParD family antitoxin [Asticcacaulis sp. AND118]